MAIKELITLEGIAEIEDGLAKIKKAGEESLAAFRKLGSDASGVGFNKISDSAKSAGQEMLTLGKHTNSLAQILRVLKPALAEAGASVGGLGTFARLAGGGLVALGAALTGAVVVKMADLEEAAAATKLKLADLFGSTAAGEKAFNVLDASARTLHTTTQELLPSVEALTRGIDKFNQTNRGFKFVALNCEDLPIGFAPDIDKTTAAVTNLFKILRASGLSTEQANTASKEFFTTLRAGGQVTADMLNKLPTGTVEALAIAFGKGAMTAEQLAAALTKTPEPIDKATKGLANFTKQADQSFDTKAVKSYKDSLDDLLKSVEDLFKQQTGQGSASFLQNLLDNTRKEVDAIGQVVAQLKADIRETITPTTVPGGPAGTPTADQAALVEQFRQTGVQSAEAFQRGFQGQLPQTQSLFQSLYDSVVAIFAKPIPVNWQTNTFLSGQPTNLASGGFVRGPGTTTSDSILAFLSNREFVVNARAVSHYGAELFSALNAMRLPQDFISKFSMGGLARAMSGNRFAGGGQVSSGTPVILNIDRQSFNMTAGSDTVAALKRYSVAAQLSSTGRKPSWVK